MPFLRISRDKRGYEHTYLIHTSPKKGGAARILYWFRTPPGVKVGRAAFDDEVRRALEAQYPSITFDWPKLMEAPPPPPDVEHWRERRRLEKAARQARRASEREDADETVAGETAVDHQKRGGEDGTAASASGSRATGDVGREPADPDLAVTASQDESIEGIALDVDDQAAGGEPAPAEGSVDLQPSAAAPEADASGGAPRPTRKRRRRGGRRRRRTPAEGESAVAAAVAGPSAAGESDGADDSADAPDAGSDDGIDPADDPSSTSEASD